MLLFEQSGHRNCKISHHRRWGRCMPLQPWSWAGGKHSGKTRNIPGARVHRMWLWRVHSNWIVSAVDVANAGVSWLPSGNVSSLWCKHNFYCTFRYTLCIDCLTSDCPVTIPTCYVYDPPFLSSTAGGQEMTGNLAHQLLSCSLSKI